MTDSETIEKQEKQIEKLKRKIARLEKRLLEKARYEDGLLLGTGAHPNMIAKIHEKDRAALSD